MKILFVAVSLSLISACQPAPLVCEQLVKPVDQSPDLAGKWYYIAFATETCFPSTLLTSLFWPSLVVDVTSKGKQNAYDSTVKMKMYGFCFNESEPFFHQNNKIFDLDSNDAPTGDPDILLQTSCPDCIVVKSNDLIDTLLLLSRRQVVSDAEIKEFQTQAKCLRWSKPKVLNTDHDYENCKDLEAVTDDEASALLQKIAVKVQESRQSLLSCFSEFALSYLPSFFS